MDKFNLTDLYNLQMATNLAANEARSRGDQTSSDIYLDLFNRLCDAHREALQALTDPTKH